jgi:hypothetical protein
MLCESIFPLFKTLLESSSGLLLHVPEYFSDLPCQLEGKNLLDRVLMGDEATMQTQHAKIRNGKHQCAETKKVHVTNPREDNAGLCFEPQSHCPLGVS